MYVAAGLAIGYLLWGTRVGVLSEALNRTILEQDALRVIMHRQERVLDKIGSGPRVDQGEVTALRLRLDEAYERSRVQLGENQAALAAAQAETTERTAALEQCNEIQSKLQDQLEICIFEKAELHRRSRMAPSAAERPRSGRSPIEEVVVYPAVPANSGDIQ